MGSFPLPNVIDIAALIFIVLGVLLGFRRGLSGELARLISTVIVFLTCMHFYHPLTAWLLENSTLSGRSAQAAAFIIMIIVLLIAATLIRYILKKIIKVAVDKKADKVGGMIAGFIRSMIIVVIVFIIMNMIPHEYLNRKFGEESFTGTLVLKSVKELREEVEERSKE